LREKFKMKRKMFRFLPKGKKEMGRFLPKGKKGAEFLHGSLIFIILNLLFFAGMFYFVARSSGGLIVTEQIYARQIALVIDSAKPGTEIELDVGELYDFADKNDFDRLQTVKIDNELNQVIVSCASGKGHFFEFFSGYDVIWELRKKSKTLYMRIEEKNNN